MLLKSLHLSIGCEKISLSISALVIDNESKENRGPEFF